ncbi:helix-turn-helix transcriptional regulator [Pseudomonas sp. GOM6]|uniref:helix-turn-helix domain-containing protein n=1 Tax=Pseudomonas sp. GOM6 TaxID=3036944 RepID=UPI002409A32E|nr:helix-turn-helix transcriptional regulator [Pseudomonas sp. GOM6]MDG1580992.1 helix-turn-helix transcriptional regulator [Pseudomonas sp. GOM6]
MSESLNTASTISGYYSTRSVDSGFAMEITPFGQAVRLARLKVRKRLNEMAAAMGLSDSYLSAVETGRKPVNDDVVSRAIEYLTSLDGKFDGRELREAADLTRGTVSIAGLCPEASALMVQLSHRFAAMGQEAQLAEAKRIQQKLGMGEAAHRRTEAHV